MHWSHEKIYNIEIHSTNKWRDKITKNVKKIRKFYIDYFNSAIRGDKMLKKLLIKTCRTTTITVHLDIQYTKKNFLTFAW